MLGSLGNSPIDDAGLKIESSGAAGTLIAQLTSIDQNRTICVDVPLKDAGPGFIGTGAHPFHLDGDSQAVVHLKNLAAEPTTAIVQILYDSGEFSPELIPIQPGQSVSVDLRQLRDSRARDVHGHQLPVDLTSGEVQWFQHGKQSVIGRLVASSPSLGVSASFACGGVCCPPSFSSSWVDPGSLIGSPGDSFGLTVWETDETCGQFYGPYNITAYASCTSTDSSVAQVSGSSINLVGAGNCTINVDHLASTFTRQPGTDCESGPCEIVCDQTDTMMTDPVPVTARPTVVISGPDAVPLAGTMGILTPAPISSVQLIGTGNPPGGTFSWSTSSPHVTLSNTSSDTVTVTSVSESSGPLDVAIVLIYAVNGQGNSATKQITVQKPTFMTFMSVDSQGPRSCANDPSTGLPEAGWTKVITWQLQDKWNQPIGSVPSYDTLTGSSQNNGCFLTFAGTPPGGAVGPTGLWQHEYGICSTACPNGGTCTTLADWNFFANGWQIVLPITFHCNSITVDGH